MLFAQPSMLIANGSAVYDLSIGISSQVVVKRLSERVILYFIKRSVHLGHFPQTHPVIYGDGRADKSIIEEPR